MKRLKQYFLMLDKKDTTYEAIYRGAYGYTKRGELVLNNPKLVGRTDKESEYEREAFQDSTYWDGDVSYYFFRTHKSTPDKPSITIRIPFGLLDISEEMLDIVVADFGLRYFEKKIIEMNRSIYNRSRPDRENGAFYCQHPYTTVRTRNSSFITSDVDDKYLNLMIMIQFPLEQHKKAIKMVCSMLPDAVREFIYEFNVEELRAYNELYIKQERIRAYLKNSEYCCFIANGSILPHDEVEGNPIVDAIPFISPDEDEIEIEGICGMGIRRGVTVITGGGYSGKSTLLDAIHMGIYNHISGDGREFVITDESAIKVSAEDGRCIHNVKLTPFIKKLPVGDTEHFSSKHASGSTSQAANIMEAINYESKLLLIDEDKSATNFMIRDRAMKKLIKDEPITPFTERVNELYESENVSTILVVGGSCEFIPLANQVYMMNNYMMGNCTNEAKKISSEYVDIAKEKEKKAEWRFDRILNCMEFSSFSHDNNSEILDIFEMNYLKIGKHSIDLRMVSEISTYEQLCGIGVIIRQMMKMNNTSKANLVDLIEDVYEKIDREGLDSVYSTTFLMHRWLELPRKSEIWAAINRATNLSFLS